MYVLIAGGGKVGANLTRSLLRAGHEITLVEQKPYRYDKLEAEFEHRVLRGDATELFVLERAGIKRPPDLVVAATGDDEDNIVICQLSREKYGVGNVIAQAAQKQFAVPTVVVRILDPARAQFYATRGLRIVCPTSSAIETLVGAVRESEQATV